MSASLAEQTVLVDVAVTMHVAVAFPDGMPADAQQVARDLAAEAAQRLTHVSAQELAAFNEVNRLHPHGAGVVTGVDCQPDLGS